MNIHYNNTAHKHMAQVKRVASYWARPSQLAGTEDTSGWSRAPRQFAPSTAAAAISRMHIGFEPNCSLLLIAKAGAIYGAFLAGLHGI
jgi:hypothetical protein